MSHVVELRNEFDVIERVEVDGQARANDLAWQYGKFLTGVAGATFVMGYEVIDKFTAHSTRTRKFLSHYKDKCRTYHVETRVIG